MAEKKDQWTLHIGAHDGTITGRDRERPQTKNSLQECREEVVKAESYYTGVGYYIWFAHAIDPDGKEHVLHPGTPYRR